MYINALIGLSNNQKTMSWKFGAVSWNDVDLVQDNRNLQGDLYRHYGKKVVTNISINYPTIDFSELNVLLSIKNSITGFLYLTLFDANSPYLQFIDEKRISTATTLVTLRKSSRRGITIDGVWLATDTGHTGTNYYTNGSYVQETQIITLGTVLPDANTEVIINYKYTGWKVVFASQSPAITSLPANLFNLQMNFIGV